MEMKRGQRLNIMELIIETQSESLLTAPLSRSLSENRSRSEGKPF